MEYGNGEKNQLVWKNIENKYHNANFDVDESNRNVNVAMLAKYVEPGETILDIGCGEGKFGIVLKEKQCNLYGIDIDFSACQGASESGHYKKIFCVNIEKPEQTSAEYQEFLEGGIKFDKIALIDILEHVIDPTAVINNVVKLLKDGGKILVSVPNVNNGDILLNLMRDHFNYRDAGVLDNTHTKYFTKHSFAEWIEEINEIYEYTLDCEYVGSTFGYTDYLEEIKNTKPHVYQFIQANPYFHVMQHLFVLSYSVQKDKTKCLSSLLEEKIDLTETLENILANSDNIKGIELLPNERAIFEERCESSEKGWVKCAEELSNANKRIEELNVELQKLVTKINEDSEELQRAGAKINEQELELQRAGAKINEQELELQKAGAKIDEQGLELQKACVYQQKLEEDLQNAEKQIQDRKQEYKILSLKYDDTLKELENIKKKSI